MKQYESILDKLENQQPSLKTLKKKKERKQQN